MPILSEKKNDILNITDRLATKITMQKRETKR